jgi:PAS domain-containing protein
MLLDFLTRNRSEIIASLCQRIRQTTPAYEKVPVPELEERVTKGVDAFLFALRDNDLAPLDRFIADTVASRTVEEFPLTMLHAGFTAFGDLLLPLLRACYGNNTACLITDLQRLHGLKDAILQRLVEQYETRTRAVFRQQQERLHAYSRQLEEQLIQVGEEYQTLQDFNESILQSMTSGLLVADKETHRILKINRAMERLGGVEAAAVVGKTVEEVFAGLRGLPLGVKAPSRSVSTVCILRRGESFISLSKVRCFTTPGGRTRV